MAVCVMLSAEDYNGSTQGFHTDKVNCTPNSQVPCIIVHILQYSVNNNQFLWNYTVV